MKILLSPSKTKNLSLENETLKNILFPQKTNYLIEKLGEIDLEKLYKSSKLKDKYEKLYNNFSDLKTYKGLLSYDGLVFKNLDIKTLNKNLDKICILSALYGIVTKDTTITEYRLDLVDNILKDTKYLNMYKFWEKEVNSYLEKEDLVINLASNEYSKLIKHKNMYSIEFLIETKDGKLVKRSTDSKIKRGIFARYILEKDIFNIEEIKKIQILDLKLYKIEGKIIYFK